MIVVPQAAFHARRVAMGEELPPIRIVRDLARAGAREIAIHDLDGTVASDVLPQWTEAIVAIAADVPVWFDGRLHDGTRLERLARAGFGSVVVDQAAVFDPILLRWALDLYGPRLVVEVQVDERYVFDPPPPAYGRELIGVLGDLHFQGVRRLLYRDVTGEHVPTQRLLELADRLPGMRITYQGRVRDVEAIAELALVGPAVEAVTIDAQLVLDGTLPIDAANRAAASMLDH